jgi:hypothetical protein
MRALPEKEKPPARPVDVYLLLYGVSVGLVGVVDSWLSDFLLTN